MSQKNRFCHNCKFVKIVKIKNPPKNLANPISYYCHIRSVPEYFPKRGPKDWCGEWVGFDVDDEKKEKK